MPSTMRFAILWFCLLWLPVVSIAQCSEYEAGEVYFGVNQYIEYRPGTMPLIISVPHGGELQPGEIPDRDCDGCVYVNDAYTVELGNELFDALEFSNGCRPHLIINHLHRRKLDGNRNLAEATDGHPLAAEAWHDFHHFINAAKECVSNTHGAGFYVDLHGHGHTVQRIEYGYLLYEDELMLPNTTLNTSTYVNWSSIRNLVSTNIMGLNHADLLRGAHALGTLVDNLGYPGVPSATDPAPLVGQPYFSGGYNTVVHSSYQGGNIDGVQIECNQNIRFNPETRQQFAVDLAEGLNTYLELHFDLPSGLCGPLMVENYQTHTFRPIPNPGSGYFYLSGLGKSAVVDELQIVDPMGRVISTIRQHHTNTPVYVNAPGLYLVVVRSGLSRASFRWINH